MSAPTKGPVDVRRGVRILNAIQVFPWDDAGALQNLVQGSLLRPDWVAIVPPYLDRPAWIPKSAERHSMGADTAFTWRDA